MEHRFRVHEQKLLAGTHHSAHLQNAWKKYGPEKFEFSIVEIVDAQEQLTKREQYWIDKFDTYHNGFNRCPSAEGTLGTTRTAETLAKMSLSQRRINMQGGQPQCKLTPVQVREIKQLIVDGEFTASIAKTYGISRANVRRIAQGIAWTYVPGPMLSPEQLKQRSFRNMQRASSRLTPDDIRVIRMRVAAGESHRTVARDYNTSHQNISGIWNGETWTHIPSPYPAAIKEKRNKLTESDVKQIKQRLLSGEKPVHISQDYPVSAPTIYDIKWGRTWTHID